jgi:hypothetical protein
LTGKLLMPLAIALPVWCHGLTARSTATWQYAIWRNTALLLSNGVYFNKLGD